MQMAMWNAAGEFVKIRTGGEKPRSGISVAILYKLERLPVQYYSSACMSHDDTNEVAMGGDNPSSYSLHPFQILTVNL